VKFLTYKAKKIGKRIIEIDESNTTKTCYLCGKKEKRKLSDRVITCDCENNIGRDHNSAVNIMLLFLSHQPPVNGESPKKNFLDGLHRQTAPRVIEAVVDSMEAPPLRAG
jgi:putative transposase